MSEVKKLLLVQQNCRDEDSKTSNYRALYDLDTGRCIVQKDGLTPWDIIDALGFNIVAQPMGRGGDGLLNKNKKLPNCLTALNKKAKKLYGYYLPTIRNMFT